MAEINQQQTAREKAFFLYTSAIERGDLDTVQAILAQAEQDPELEQMILDLNDLFAEEEQTQQEKEADKVVRNLTSKYLVSATPFDPNAQHHDEKVPALRVGDVLAQMQADAVAQGRDTLEIAKLLPQFKGSSDKVLPVKLDKNGVRQLFEQAGIKISPFLQKTFRDKAIEMSMRREQHEAQLAARRQKPETKNINTDRKA